MFDKVTFSDDNFFEIKIKKTRRNNENREVEPLLPQYNLKLPTSNEKKIFVALLEKIFKFL